MAGPIETIFDDQSVTTPISSEGIWDGKNTISWRDFKAMDDGQRRATLKNAGLSTTEAASLISDFNKTGGVAWKATPDEPQSMFSPEQKALKTADDPGRMWASKDFQNLYNQLAGEQAQRQQASKLQSESGTAPASSSSTPAPKAAADPQYFPAYDENALNNYTHNYVQPIIQDITNTLSGFQNNLTGKLQGPTSSLYSQMMSPKGNAGGSLQDIVSRSTADLAMMQPYFSVYNNAIAEQAKIGAANQAQGQIVQNILGYNALGGTNNPVANVLNALGLGTNASSALAGGAFTPNLGGITNSGIGVTSPQPTP